MPTTRLPITYRVNGQTYRAVVQTADGLKTPDGTALTGVNVTLRPAFAPAPDTECNGETGDGGECGLSANWGRDTPVKTNPGRCWYHKDQPLPPDSGSDSDSGSDTDSGTDTGSGGDSDETGTAEEHLIVLTGTRAGANYTLSVDGTLTKSDEVGSKNAADELDGATVSGSVYGGQDAFVFTGSITEFTVDGELSRVTIDGTAVATDAVTDWPPDDTTTDDTSSTEGYGAEWGDDGYGTPTEGDA